MLVSALFLEEMITNVIANTVKQSQAIYWKFAMERFISFIKKINK
jgi:hypothetical protein